MGSINIDNTGSGGAITLSSDGTSLLLGGSAVGGADLYLANASSATANTVTGANAIGIGSNNTASGESSLSFGVNATASQVGAFAVGRNTTASGADSFAFGASAVSSGSNTLAIGSNTDATGNSSVAIGNTAQSVGAYSVALGQSYASGTDSFAAAIATNGSSYGATGDYSIALGRNAKATSSDSLAFGRTTQATTAYATAIGYNCLASGNYSVALGYATTASGNNSIAAGASSTYNERANATGHGSVALGGAYANGVDSVAIGASAKSTQIGKISFSNDKFSAVGDSQGGQFILRCDTTDATATVLTTNNSSAGSTNQIVAASDTCITFDGTITAMQNGAQAYASWRIEGLLVNDGGTTTLANSATTVIDNQSDWVMALSADNTNNALAIACTGEASHNIRWVANIRTTEVTYA